MPVRSSTSSVVTWPDARTVEEALRVWATTAIREHPEILRVGYIGSYARGDWGVGSDLDVVIVVARSEEPFESRGRAWDLTTLPVPADVLTYTADEWASLLREGRRFTRVVEDTAVWVFDKDRDLERSTLSSRPLTTTP
jgi:predicted nucleotidyltransferase